MKTYPKKQIVLPLIDNFAYQLEEPINGKFTASIEENPHHKSKSEICLKVNNAVVFAVDREEWLKMCRQSLHKFQIKKFQNIEQSFEK